MIGEVTGTAATGWTVRLRVHAEHVAVERRSVVREEALVRRRPAQEEVRVETERRYEEPVVERVDLERTQPLGAPRPRRDAFEPPYEI